MYHAPPPLPSKRKNHHQILNMYFSLFTFRVELGFGKLNKHKNEKKKKERGEGSTQPAAVKGAVKNHASSASITFCRLLMLSKRKQRV